MRYYIITCCLILTFIHPAFGQLTKLWELNLPTYYKGQRSFNLNSSPYLKYVECIDGNRIVVGLNRESRNNQIYLFKHDTDGQIVWEYKYPSPYKLGEEIEDIILDSNGDVVIIGSTITYTKQDSNGYTYNRNSLILKISQSGELLWALENKEQDSEFNSCKTVFPDSNGILYTAHLFTIDSVFRTFLYKINTDGEIIWKRQVDQNIPLLVYSISDTIVLITKSEGISSNLYQFTNNGALLHTKTLGLLSYEKIVFDTEGNWYLRSGGGKFKVIKMDKYGNSKWTYHKQTNLPSNVYGDELIDVCVTQKGDVFATGRYYGSNYNDTSKYTNCDILTVKLDANGIVQWENIYRYDNRRSCQIGEKIVVDSLEYVYVTGYQSVETKNNLFGSSDMVLLKYDPDGKKIDSIYQDGRDHEEDLGVNLAVNSKAVYLYGWSEGKDGNYFQSVIKYANLLSSKVNSVKKQDILVFTNSVNGGSLNLFCDFKILSTWITDLSGRVVYQDPFTQCNSISKIYEKIPSGLYYLSVMTKTSVITKAFFIP